MTAAPDYTVTAGLRLEMTLGRSGSESTVHLVDADGNRTDLSPMLSAVTVEAGVGKRTRVGLDCIPDAVVVYVDDAEGLVVLPDGSLWECVEPGRGGE